MHTTVLYSIQEGATFLGTTLYFSTLSGVMSVVYSRNKQLNFYKESFVAPCLVVDKLNDLVAMAHIKNKMCLSKPNHAQK